MTMPYSDASTFTRLFDICDQVPFEVADSICIGDADNARENRAGFDVDPTGFEAFVNHVHLAELWPTELHHSLTVDFLHRMARVVIGCWCISLLPLLRGRAILFYAGGSSPEEYTLRFHVDRGAERSWLDLDDAAFIRENQIVVWRFSTAGLEQLRS